MGPSDPDAALMLAFRAGDERAFEALVARFGKPVVRYLTRMVHDGATAEDLARISHRSPGPRREASVGAA
jgi:hypothetical protein